MGDHEITRILDILDTIRAQANTLAGRAEEKEKRCIAHQEEMKNLQARLLAVETRLTAIESAKSISGDWITKLLAIAGIAILVYAAMKH